jgi:GTPase involved in cell partitioning and DNA repair
MSACCSVGGSSAGVPGLRCWDQLQLLQEELAAYSPQLSALPAIILANKVELLRSPKATITALRRRTQLPVRHGCC